MKYLLFIWILFYAHISFAQQFWQEEISVAELSDTVNNPYWILDTCSFQTSENAFSRNIHAISGVYSVAAHQIYLNKLNRAYQNNDPEAIHKLLDSDAPSSVKRKPFPVITNYKIPQLIGAHYEKHLNNIWVENPVCLSTIYSIEMGNIKKGNPNIVYNEEEDVSYKWPEYMDTQTASDLILHYKQTISGRKIYHLNPDFRLALKSFLKYDFTYAEDERTSLPSNILPVGETLDKLNFLKPFLNPRVEVLRKGACHAHIFWNLDWNFTTTKAISKIGLDKKENKGYVYYKDQNRNEFCTIYRLTNTGWKELENVDISDNINIIDHAKHKQLAVIYFMIICVLLLLYLFFKKFNVDIRCGN